MQLSKKAGFTNRLIKPAYLFLYSYMYTVQAI